MMEESSEPTSKRTCLDAPAFRATSAPEVERLTDCATLTGGSVLMPWMGFGTYRLGASSARSATLSALKAGYRQIDTAYIYAGEKCEPEVGKAISDALSGGVIASREALFVVTKHWRKVRRLQQSEIYC